MRLMVVVRSVRELGGAPGGECACEAVAADSSKHHSFVSDVSWVVAVLVSDGHSITDVLGAGSQQHQRSLQICCHMTHGFRLQIHIGSTFNTLHEPGILSLLACHQLHLSLQKPCCCQGFCSGILFVMQSKQSSRKLYESVSTNGNLAMLCHVQLSFQGLQGYSSSF